MTATHQALEQLLGRETDGVRRLLAILKAEHLALEQRDGDGLEQAVAEKQQLVGELEKLARERLSLLQRAGLSPNRAGFEALLQQAGGGQADRLSELWGELHAALAEAQQQNQINGMLIEPSRRHTQQALAILLGGQGGTELYDQQGAASSTGLGGRTSFRA